MYDCIRFRWEIQIKCLKHAFTLILNMKIVQSTQGIVSNMGCASKSQSIDIQNPKRSPFNNMDLVWRKNVWHGEAHIIKVECAYISHAWVPKNLMMNESMKIPNGMEYLWMGTPIRKCKNAKNTKPLWPYLVWCSIVHFCYMGVF